MSVHTLRREHQPRDVISLYRVIQATKHRAHAGTRLALDPNFYGTAGIVLSSQFQLGKMFVTRETSVTKEVDEAIDMTADVTPRRLSRWIPGLSAADLKSGVQVALLNKERLPARAAKRRSSSLDVAGPRRHLDLSRRMSNVQAMHKILLVWVVSALILHII